MRDLLLPLAREEFRLHSDLFGGRRFAPFPLLVAAVSAATVWALDFAGTPVGDIVAGTHLLVLGFGLYTGTAGLVGSDLIERVLGDRSLLLSASAYLPVSKRDLLGAFMLKDAAYYAVLFILPVGAGFAPLVASGALRPVDLLALPYSLSLLFAAGMTVTFALIALRTRGAPASVLGLAVGAAVVAGWYTGYLAPAWNALVVFDAPLAPAALSLLLGTPLVGALALRLYDPGYRRPARTRTAAFGRWQRRLPDEQGLLTRTLLDLGRSSGGFAKPVVSAAVLLLLTVFLDSVAAAVVGVEAAPGLFYGSVLGLSAFTTYSWLTQFDSLAEYRPFPVGIEAVFRAKRVAFAIVGLPPVLLAYAAAIAYAGTGATDAVLGLLLLLGLSAYCFGLTVYLAGLDPNAFLFDTVRFGLFTVGVAVPVVPAVLVGFVAGAGTLSTGLVAGVAVGALVLGVVGVALARRAGPKWADAD